MFQVRKSRFCGISAMFSGFDITTRDSCFTILVEVFTNHISAENTYFTNRVNRTQDYDLKICKQVPDYLALP